MKLKVLWCSETPLASTGYGRITKDLLGRLSTIGKREGIIDYALHAWYHPPSITSIPGINYKIFPAMENEDEYNRLARDSSFTDKKMGSETFDSVVAKFAPDIVVSVADSWMVKYIATSKMRKTFKWVAYVPVDGVPLTQDIRSVCTGADCVITMSRFGEAVIVEEIPSCRPQTIYLGVDTKIFRPMHPELRAKHKSSSSLEGKFIVQVVARNQPRKRIDRAIECYSEFAKNKKDTALYLHMAESDYGGSIRDLADSICPGLNIILTDNVNPSTGVSEEQYCTILNLADVGMLTTGGEGFGLPIIEWMACGIPVLATDYAATRELVSGRGELLPVQTFFREQRSNVNRALVDVAGAVDKLNMFYYNPDIGSGYAKKGYDFAQTLDWWCIAEQWNEVLLSVYESRRLDTPFFRDIMRPVRMEAI